MTYKGGEVAGRQNLRTFGCHWQSSKDFSTFGLLLSFPDSALHSRRWNGGTTFKLVASSCSKKETGWVVDWRVKIGQRRRFVCLRRMGPSGKTMGKSWIKICSYLKSDGEVKRGWERESWESPVRQGLCIAEWFQSAGTWLVWQR